MIDTSEWMMVIGAAIVRRHDHYRIDAPMRLVGEGGQQVEVSAHTFNSAGANRLGRQFLPGEIERESHAALDNMFSAAEEITVGRRGPETIAVVATRGSRASGPEPISLREIWND